MMVRKIWESLDLEVECQKASSDKIVVRQLPLKGDRAQVVGIHPTSGRYFHFLQLYFGEECSAAAFPNIKGLTVQCEQSLEFIDLEGPWVVLSMLQPEKKEVFFALSSDLAEKIGNTNRHHSITEATANVLVKWKTFFQKGMLGVLSGEGQQGLFGELVVLKDFLAQFMPLSRAVRYWVGGLRKAQDFIFPHFSIEVKARLLGETQRVHISSLSQLSSLEGRSIVLVVVFVSVSKAVGEPLPELIGSLRTKLKEAEDYASYDQFEENLLGYGYVDGFEDYYKDKYSYKGWVMYEVTEGFPRLIVGNIPRGVEEVSYHINLLACSDFEIDYEKVAFKILNNLK